MAKQLQSISFHLTTTVSSGYRPILPTAFTITLPSINTTQTIRTNKIPLQTSEVGEDRNISYNVPSHFLFS